MAVAAVVAVGVASTAYQSHEQKKAAKQQREEAARLQEEQQAIEANIMQQEAVISKEASITFGDQLEEESTSVGSYSEFITPLGNIPSTKSKAKGSTGLGFGV